MSDVSKENELRLARGEHTHTDQLTQKRKQDSQTIDLCANFTADSTQSKWVTENDLHLDLRVSLWTQTAVKLLEHMTILETQATWWKNRWLCVKEAFLVEIPSE